MTTRLRLLSWNVRGLRDDVAAMTALVRELDPDVFCVQEAPKFGRWRERCAAFARDCGLSYVAGGGTTGGTALLVHLRVNIRRRLEIPLSRKLGWPDRGLAAAVVRKGQDTFATASLHLPLDTTPRLAQTARIVDLVASLDQPHVLLAGDLNERPPGPTWQRLRDAGWRDLAPHGEPTFPSPSPDRRIDGVLASADVSPVSFEVVDDPRVAWASDHRPILATVEIRQSAGGADDPVLTSMARD